MKKKLVNLIFGISLGVLFLLCLLTYDRLSTFNKYTNIVDNSHKVLLAISNLRAGFNTSIAEQRTYLITKDTTYYNNFQQKKDSLRHTIQEFKKLTRDSKIHQFYIKKLEIEANNRIQSLLVEILNDTSKAEFKFEQLELIDDNQAINKSYFAILEIINTHENQLLRKRLRIKEFEEQFAPFLLIILALIAMGILIYSFTLINDELKRRDKTTKLLEESVKELNTSNRELEQYAYVASHDLQEPLRKIRLFSGKLLADHSGHLDDEASHMLRRMNLSAERMTALIKDLLGLSRLLSEKPTFQFVNLNEIVEQSLAEFDEVIREQKIQITTTKLPTIQGHSGQLHQLFQNLIGNAIKFRKDKGISKVSVRNYEVIKWKGDKGFKYHHIAIRDNGRGFDNDFKEKMFTIFGRLGKTAEVQGTGIGLSICSRIMQNHEGEIDAEGKLNLGATLHLYFPQSQ